jgi:hypothetical protein
MVENENGKFNQNKGNFKKKIQIFKSLRMPRVPPAQRNAYIQARKTTFNYVRENYTAATHSKHQKGIFCYIDVL